MVNSKKALAAGAAVLIVVVSIFCISRLTGNKRGINAATNVDRRQTAAVNAESVDELDLSDPVYGTEVGNTYKFGSYEQDNNIINGKEEIEWIVLAKENNKLLLISKYVLDDQPFNAERSDTTWETCTLRKWLNDEFYNEAFGLDEQNRIQPSVVSADKNPSCDTSPGNDTNDKILIISITEAEKYFSSETARYCSPTAYAKERGAYTDNWIKKNEGKEVCWWWLRSPGSSSHYAAFVAGGAVNDFGWLVNSDRAAVRPALWINTET